MLMTAGLRTEGLKDEAISIPKILTGKGTASMVLANTLILVIQIGDAGDGLLAQFQGTVTTEDPVECEIVYVDDQLGSEDLVAGFYYPGYTEPFYLQDFIRFGYPFC